MIKERNEESKVDLPSLPPGWCWTTLATIADIDGGITKDQKRRRTPTMREVPYLRVANVQRSYLNLQEIKTILAEDEEIAALRLRKGDVLFTEGGDRDKLGRGWVWNDEIDECIHQNHIFRARLCLPLVEPKFVSYHGNFFGQHWFTKTGKQTTNLASINKGVLSRFPIPLAALNEQRRIVAKIEELFSDLDAGVAALERIKANLKRHRAAVLKAAVEGKLTEEWRAKHPNTEPASKLLERILAERRQKWEKDQLAKFAAVKKTPPTGWRERYVEPPAPDTSQLSELPHGWCWASMEQLLVYLRNGYFQSPSGADQGTPILRINAVRPMSVDLSETRFLDNITGDMKEYFIEDGDLLFTRYNGSIDLLGVAGMVRGCGGRILHPDKLIRVKLAIGQPLSDFVEIAANVGASRKHMIGRARTTAGQTGISGTDIREMPAPLPPLEEQGIVVAEVSERLSQIAAADTLVQHGLIRAARLRQSILKCAFEGRLVPQDPTDEPASDLLARIRAERTKAEARDAQRPAGKRKGRQRGSLVMTESGRMALQTANKDPSNRTCTHNKRD
jgi:type I restriction enzyme S subunit